MSCPPSPPGESRRLPSSLAPSALTPWRAAVYGAEFGTDKDSLSLVKSAGCQEHGCGNLTGDAMECYKLDTPWASYMPHDAGAWQYLSFDLEILEGGNETADPDLYGMFATKPAKDKPLENKDAYDFRETSSKSRKHSSITVSKKNIGYGNDYKYAYVCVHAYDVRAVYDLRAVSSECPSEFFLGDARVCSSPFGAEGSEKRYSQCSEAKCACKPPYDTPKDYFGKTMEVYDTLGFDDCGASVQPVKLSGEKPELNKPREFQVKGEHVEVGAWNFYQVNVTDDDWQMHVTLDCDSCNATHSHQPGYHARPMLYMKYGTPPGLGWDRGSGEYMYDFKPRYYGDVEVLADATNPKFRPGTWFIGVYGTGNPRTLSKELQQGFDYSLSMLTYNCPHGCNGRGKECKIEHESLRNSSRSCSCQGNYFMEDCSGEADPLEYNKPKLLTFEGQYDYFELPQISPSESTRNVELSLKASYSGFDCRWQGCNPVLLVQQGAGDDYPKLDSYTAKTELLSSGKEFQLSVCASSLQQGMWRGAMFNPRDYLRMNYNITVEKKVYCLNDCTSADHGTCGDNGICQCKNGFAGGDCSVSTMCTEGTRKKEVQGGGICWKECKCNTSGGHTKCGYSESCKDFECVPPKRWTGQGTQCVEDACSADQFVVDPVTKVGCLKRCRCAAGRACSLDTMCDASSAQCVDSFAVGDGQCGVSHCVEGSWLHNKAVKVKHGKCVATCTCKRGKCNYSEKRQHCTLFCDEGYMADGEGKECVAIPGEIIDVEKTGVAAWGVAVTAAVFVLAGVLLGGCGMFLYHRKFKRQQAAVGMAGYSNFSDDF